MPAPIRAELRQAILADYLAGMTIAAIAEKNQVAYGTVFAVARTSDVDPEARKAANRKNRQAAGMLQRSFSPEQDAQIAREHLSGASVPDLAAKYQTNTTAIHRSLDRTGITKKRFRRHTLNEAVFDFAEQSEEASYYVGLLMADGSIGHTSSGWCALKLALAEEDAEHVHQFRDFLGSTHTVTVYHNQQARWNSQPAHQVQVQSARMAAALGRYGVLPQKSQRERVYILGMSPHFWRGMVCGDGSLYIDSAGNPCISLASSRDLMEQYLAFCRTLFVTDSQPSPNKTIWQVAFNGPRAYRVIKALFANATTGLPRKMTLAQRILHDYARLGDTIPRPFTHNLTAQDIEAAFQATGSWKASAERLGVFEPGLHQMRKRLGMEFKSRRRPRMYARDLTHDMIMAAFEEAGNWNGAAALLGVSAPTLMEARKRLGMPAEWNPRWHKD